MRKKMMLFMMMLFLFYVVGLGISYGIWTDKNSITVNMSTGSIDFAYLSPDEVAYPTYEEDMTIEVEKEDKQHLTVTTVPFEKLLEKDGITIPFAAKASDENQPIQFAKEVTKEDIKNTEKEIKASLGENNNIILRLKDVDIPLEHHIINEILPKEIVLKSYYTLAADYDKKLMIGEMTVEAKEELNLNDLITDQVKRTILQTIPSAGEEDFNTRLEDATLVITADYSFELPMLLEQP